MDNNLIELGYVLDRSGSMTSRVTDVIGGFNGLIDAQRKQPGRASITIVGFDSNISGPVHEVIANGVDINAIEPLNPRTYFARGGTPLFDAIAYTIDLIGNRLRSTPENLRPGKVLLTVMTDGDENESREFDRHSGGAAKLREKIKHQQDKYAWDVVFLGANMDAVLAGSEFGLGAAKAMSWASTPQGVYGSYAVMNNYITRSRSAPSAVEALCSNSFTAAERSTAMGNEQKSVAGIIGGVGIMPTVDSPAATSVLGTPVDNTSSPLKP